jgi:two-component system phosphate regulon sensor histidine kinase PhoR
VRISKAIRHPGFVEHIGRALKGRGDLTGLELSVTAIPRGTLSRASRRSPRQTPARCSVLHDITELRKADLVRRDFVPTFRIELRTPLTAINGYAKRCSMI